MYRFTTPLTILALGLGFQSAHAVTPEDPAPARAVQFADLDLSRTQDAAVLYERLRATADTVCAALDDRQLEKHISFRKCVKSAISSAVAKIDRPTLTAYYKARTSDHNSTIQTAQNQAR
jgi:UrcA family protein